MLCRLTVRPGLDSSSVLQGCGMLLLCGCSVLHGRIRLPPGPYEHDNKYNYRHQKKEGEHASIVLPDDVPKTHIEARDGTREIGTRSARYRTAPPYPAAPAPTVTTGGYPPRYDAASGAHS